jgi:hypothetical protein
MWGVAADPTEQDVRNAEMRQAVADRFRREYLAARELAERAFGPGWKPCGRHFLVTHDEEDRARRDGDRAQPAAEVFTAEKDGVRRHFTLRDGIPMECGGYEQGFGSLLLELDPVRGFERGGVFHHVHKHSLYWAGYEPDYRPQSAERLAAARERRQAKAVEKEAQDSPLFAEVIRAEGYVPRRR